MTEDDVELEDLSGERDPAACKRRALQLARKYRRRLHHEEDKLARACRILEAARRNDEARKKEPSTAGTAAAPSSAEAISAEPDTGSAASADFRLLERQRPRSQRNLRRVRALIRMKERKTRLHKSKALNILPVTSCEINILHDNCAPSC